MKRLLLTELAVLLFRETKWERRYGVITAADARMRDVKAYIDMNFRGKLGLEEGEDRVFQVGTKSGFESENTFLRQFGRIMGMSPLQYRKAAKRCTGQPGRISSPALEERKEEYELQI